MTLPKYNYASSDGLKSASVKQINPIYKSLFEIGFKFKDGIGGVDFKAIVKNYKENIFSYKIKNNKLSLKSYLNVENAEYFSEFINNSIEKINIVFHDKTGEIIKKILFDVSYVGFEIKGNYKSTKLQTIVLNFKIHSIDGRI